MLLTATYPICLAQVFNPLYKATQYSAANTKPLDITEALDNRAFGLGPGDADFDGSQSMEEK